MAIGIPLSSLDVVVGISGVHYVLQGLRQIDRELDSTSKKRNDSAFTAPDVSSQVRGFDTSLRSGVGGVRQMAASIRELQQVARTPMLDPNARMEAQKTIQLAKEARESARQAASAAYASTRQATAAEREYNNALREQAALTREATRLTNALDSNQLRTARIKARDYDKYVKTRTGAGLRAMDVINNSTDQKAIDRAQLYIDTSIKALNNQRKDKLKELRADRKIIEADLTTNKLRTSTLPDISALEFSATHARAQANNWQKISAGAAKYATTMQLAANESKNFLMQSVGWTTAGQKIQQVVGIVGNFAMGALSVGKSILTMGMHAGSAALEAGKFAFEFMKIPAIAGPLTGGLSLIADNFRSIATSITLVIGTLAGLSFKEVLSEGMDFEEAVSNIKAVAQYSVRGTPQGGESQRDANLRELSGQMARLDEITLKLGADTVFSNTEIAGLIETLLRGGVSVEMVTMSTVKAVADLASATKTGVGQSAEVISSIINMFGAAASDIPRFADIIAASVNTTNQSVDDFASAIRQLGPLTQALGIDFEDVATMISMVALKGYTGEMAGTSLRNMLTYMSPRTKPAIAELKSAGLWENSTEATRVVGPEQQAAYEQRLQNYNKQMANYQVRLQNYETEMANYQKAMADFNAGKRKTQPTMPTQPLAPTKPDAPKGELVAGEVGHSRFYDQQGNLKPMKELIALLQDATKGMSDEDLTQFNDKVFGKRSGAASLLLTREDADQFQKTKDLIQSVKAADVAAFRLENLKGKIELFSGSLKSLAAVFYMDWLSAPLLGAMNRLIPVANGILGFFGTKRDDGTTAGKEFINSLMKGLRSGDLGAAWVDMMATLPEGFGANEWAGRIRVLMRWMQLGRDAVITFKDALGGNWGGAATANINPIIRAVGILGTYWGNIWRNIKQLLSGEIGLRQFATNIVGGLVRLGADVKGWVTSTWPTFIEDMKTGWAKLKDFAGFVWNTVISPELTKLWGYINTEENRTKLGKAISDLFDLGKDFLGEKVTPWFQNLNKTIDDWFGKEENTKPLIESAGKVGKAIGGAVAAGLALPMMVPISIGMSNSGEVAAIMAINLLTDFLTALVVNSTAYEDKFGGALMQSFTNWAFPVSRKAGEGMGAETTSGIALALMNLGITVGGILLKGLMFLPVLGYNLGKLLGIGIVNGVVWGIQHLGGLVTKIMQGAFALMKKINPTLQIPEIDMDTSKLGQEFIDDFNKKYSSNAFDGGWWPSWIDNTMQGLQDYMGNQNNRGGASKVAADGSRQVWEQGPTGGQYVPEAAASARRDNPVTGINAPDGFLWVYDPVGMKWILQVASSTSKPSLNPSTGALAPEGFKWVFDAKGKNWVLVPASMTSVSGAVPDANAITPAGMVWIWDPTTQAWILLAANNAVPPPPPGTGGKGAGQAAAAAAAAALGGGARPNTTSVPANGPMGPVVPGRPWGSGWLPGDLPQDPNQPTAPPNGLPGLPSFPNSDGGAGYTGKPQGNLNVIIQAEGMSDDMFLNKVADRIEVLYARLNGGAAA